MENILDIDFSLVVLINSVYHKNLNWMVSNSKKYENLNHPTVIFNHLNFAMILQHFYFYQQILEILLRVVDENHIFVEGANILSFIISQ